DAIPELLVVLPDGRLPARAARAIAAAIAADHPGRLLVSVAEPGSARARAARARHRDVDPAAPLAVWRGADGVGPGTGVPAAEELDQGARHAAADLALTGRLGPHWAPW